MHEDRDKASILFINEQLAESRSDVDEQVIEYDLTVKIRRPASESSKGISELLTDALLGVEGVVWVKEVDWYRTRSGDEESRERS